MATFFIGLSITYHDPGLAIVNENGNIVFAEATERFLQYKRGINCEPDSLNRISSLLKQYCGDDANFVVATNWRIKRPLFEKMTRALGLLNAKTFFQPKYSKYDSFLEMYKFSHMMMMQNTAFTKRCGNLTRQVKEDFGKSTLEFRDYNHHLSHAAAACYTSPFSEASCLIVDSFGEIGSIAYFKYQDGKITTLKELNRFESLGFYYMKLTEICGFNWLKGEEWKVMGLAAYGRLDKNVYDILRTTMRVVSGVLKENADNIVRAIETLTKLPILDDFQLRANVAYTGQYFFAELMTELVCHAHKLCPSDNFILGGGCALNSAFNGQILSKTPFQKLHVPSAPADDGCALGCALLAYHEQSSAVADRTSPYLGSTINPKSVEKLLQFSGLKIVHLPETICQETAQLLSEGKLVAWWQNQAEFGPRALGNRSILADPRLDTIKDTINAKVKFREEFRPFAPSILDEFGTEYFENYQYSPYMERALLFKEEVRKTVPAVVHADNTGRLQSVTQKNNAKYYQLIQEFHKITKVPILLNTSFNVMGKPIVHSLEDAISVFLTSGLDILVLEDYLISKN